MKKIVLTDYADYDFSLIGICCQEDDYKLCWRLNKLLGIDFRRIEDVEIIQLKRKNLSSFPMFRYIESDTDQEEVITEDTELIYYLISNRNGTMNLVPEQKQTDYFLKIHAESDLIDEADLVRKIKELPTVLTAFSINPAELKSKENLIF